MDITERKITKIAREVSKFTVRTLRAEGIGPGKFDVLHAIRKNPGITQAGVCRITGFDKGAVARQTASLEAKGYQRREANPADGRSRCLYATAQAERLKSSKAAVETQFYGWLLDPLTEPERAHARRALPALQGWLSQRGGQREGGDDRWRINRRGNTHRPWRSCCCSAS